MAMTKFSLSATIYKTFTMKIVMTLDFENAQMSKCECAYRKVRTSLMVTITRPKNRIHVRK